MKDSLPALLILADSSEALTEVGGISLLERLRRTVLKLGFREATILSNSIESIAAHAGKSSWRRGQVSLKFHEHKAREVTIGDVVDSIGGTPLARDGHVLIVSAGFYCDERLLRVLVEAQPDCVLVDSDPPLVTKSFQEESDLDGVARPLCALLLSHDWLIGRDRVALLTAEVASEVNNDRIAAVDAAQQPAYIPSMRRNVRPVFFPAPSPACRGPAERLLQDAAQKHVLDFPAIIHAPLENWIVLRLSRTSITPNQVTLTAGMLGIGVTLLYALGHLWTGAFLALVFGVCDGLDGKLARLKAQTSKLGKGEHLLDYFIEMSWWTALAYHFQVSGQLRHAYILLLFFYAADSLERLARWSVVSRLGRTLDDASGFDRLVRLVAGRRNIYTWLFAFCLFIGMPANGFVLLCCWGMISSAIHISRAIQIGAHGSR
jgi:phosphatidylserine synthase